MTDRSRDLKRWLDILANIAFILACAAVVWMAIDRLRARREVPETPQLQTNRRVAPPVVGPISVEGLAQRGNRNAHVAVVEYSDFQCPFCVRFTHQILPDLEKQYIDTGKVLWVFRHLPIDSLHPAARDAAEAADCARRQGKFWQMHDALFTDPKAISEEFVLKSASRIGLDMPGFSSCVDSPEAEGAVKADEVAANDAGVRGTPSFLIGRLQGQTVTVTQVLVGAKAPTEFGAAIERAARAK